MNYEIKFLKDAYKLQKTSPLSIKLGLVFLFKLSFSEWMSADRDRFTYYGTCVMFTMKAHP